MIGDVERLPKWAQDRISQLEADVEYWKRLATAGPEDSDTFVRHYADDDKPLGAGQRISFRWTDGRGEWPGFTEIEAYIDGDHLTVRASNGGLYVQPSASNSIRVRVVEDF